MPHFSAKDLEALIKGEYRSGSPSSFKVISKPQKTIDKRWDSAEIQKRQLAMDAAQAEKDNDFRDKSVDFLAERGVHTSLERPSNRTATKTFAYVSDQLHRSHGVTDRFGRSIAERPETNLEKWRKKNDDILAYSWSR